MSLFRVVATPLLAILWLVLDWRIAALALGTIVGITDQLDGWVARKLNQTTELGALIDQLGDLLFESTCLIIGVSMGEVWSGWLIIYLFREFTVTVVRAYVLSNGGHLPSVSFGKVKSSCIQWAFFLLFLGSILLQPEVVPEAWTMIGIHPGRFIIWVALFWILVGIAIGLIAAAIYIRAFIDFYSSKEC
jgi:cardiolipin synthase